MYKQFECGQCLGSDSVFSQSGSFLYRFQVGDGILCLVGYAIKFAYDALFHLSRSLVGKGNGKDMSVCVGVLNEHADVVYCQCKGFTASG